VVFLTLAGVLLLGGAWVLLSLLRSL